MMPIDIHELANSVSVRIVISDINKNCLVKGQDAEATLQEMGRC